MLRRLMPVFTKARRALLTLFLVTISLPASAAIEGTIPFTMPPAVHEVRLIKNIMVPMRDGALLSTDLYLPVGSGRRWPVILARTPYNKNTWRRGGFDNTLAAARAPAHLFASQGYAVLVQDIRGTYGSQGEFVLLGRDARDGYDTTQWAATQPWSNGKVGTYGCSYLGEVQYQQATLRHPNLEAMIPQGAGAVARYRGGSLVNGGALELNSLVVWAREHGSKVNYQAPRKMSSEALSQLAEYFNPAPILPEIDYRVIWNSLPVIDMLKKAGGPPTDFEEIVRAMPPPTDLEGREIKEFTDSWWKKTDYIRHDARFDVPSLHINAWYDFGVEETLKLFNLMRANSASARARDNQFAIISPTTHCDSEVASARTQVGDRDVGNASLDLLDIYLRWYEHWLKGVDNGISKMPRLQIYVMGKNEWRAEQEWPLARSRFTKYYLHSGGKANSLFGDGGLDTVLPGAEPPDEYIYDPRSPVPTIGETGPGSWFVRQGAFDQSPVEVRQDVLVYTSPALREGIEVTGPIKAVLYVSSSAKDTDFTAKLVDVYPDGTAFNVQEGILRSRYRNGFGEKVWMESGGVYAVHIDLQSTSNYFAPEHRIRLEVSSSNFPRFDRNLNTGGNNFDETSWVVAKNTVHHSAQYPSHVLLPVVPPSEALAEGAGHRATAINSRRLSSSFGK